MRAARRPPLPRRASARCASRRPRPARHRAAPGAPTARPRRRRESAPCSPRSRPVRRPRVGRLPRRAVRRTRRRPRRRRRCGSRPRIAGRRSRSRGQRPLDRPVEVGVVADDERVLAAQLHHRLRQSPARHLGDKAAGSRGAGERDEVDARVLDERHPRLGAEPLDDVQHSRRQPRLEAEPPEPRRRRAARARTASAPRRCRRKSRGTPSMRRSAAAC